MGHIITVDIVETGRATGWADHPAYGSDFPISGTCESKKGPWNLHAGIGDEFSASGRTLEAAVKDLAATVGLTGTAVIGDETKRQKSEKVITLGS